MDQNEFTHRIFQVKIENKYLQKHVCSLTFVFWMLLYDAISCITLCHIIDFMTLLWKQYVQ